MATWIKRYPDFAELVARAEGEVERRMAATIIQAAVDGDYRAALEWLKRRRPADWGETSRYEVSGPDGKPLGAMSADEIERRAIEILARRAGDTRSVDTPE